MSLCRCSLVVCVRQSIFYVCVTCCDLDVTMRRRYKVRAREGEREEQRPLACTIQKKRRNKIRNLWLWLVCCSLLLTDRLQREAGESGSWGAGGGGGGGGGKGGKRSLLGKRRYREKKTENKQHSFFARPQRHRGMMWQERNPSGNVDSARH